MLPQLLEMSQKGLPLLLPLLILIRTCEGVGCTALAQKQLDWTETFLIRVYDFYYFLALYFVYLYMIYLYYTLYLYILNTL